MNKNKVIKYYQKLIETLHDIGSSEQQAMMIIEELSKNDVYVNKDEVDTMLFRILGIDLFISLQNHKNHEWLIKHG